MIMPELVELMAACTSPCEQEFAVTILARCPHTKQSTKNATKQKRYCDSYDRYRRSSQDNKTRLRTNLRTGYWSPSQVRICRCSIQRLVSQNITKVTQK